MSKILELREKRAKAWEAAKAFLDAKRTQEGFVSAEDAATYDKMENDVVNLGKEIERLERQAAIDAELSKATSTPITNKPDAKTGGDAKTGRATDEYRKAFWNGMRNKVLSYEVQNALTIGTDSEGGYLVPDEYEKKLVEALEEEVFFRNLATVIKTSSGDRKIPIVTSKGEAAWIDEGGQFPESDDSFGQTTISAFKLATMIKVSDELLNDSVFNIEQYISREFGRRIGTKEEEAFFIGDGKGKPTGIFNATGGAETGVTSTGTSITFDDVMDLYYSLRAYEGLAEAVRSVILSNQDSLKNVDTADLQQYGKGSSNFKGYAYDMLQFIEKLCGGMAPDDFTQQLKKTVVYTGYTHDPTSSLYRIDGDNYSGMGMYIPNSFTTPKYLLWNNYFKSSIAWYHASGWAETESIWGN